MTNHIERKGTSQKVKVGSGGYDGGDVRECSRDENVDVIRVNGSR